MAWWRASAARPRQEPRGPAPRATATARPAKRALSRKIRNSGRSDAILDETMLVRPSAPLDLLGVEWLEPLRHLVIVREYPETVARPPGRRRDRPIEAQEREGAADCSRPLVIALAVTSHGAIQRLQRGPNEAQRPPGRDRRPGALQRPWARDRGRPGAAGDNLGERPVPSKRSSPSPLRRSQRSGSCLPPLAQRWTVSRS